MRLVPLCPPPMVGQSSGKDAFCSAVSARLRCDSGREVPCTHKGYFSQSQQGQGAEEAVQSEVRGATAWLRTGAASVRVSFTSAHWYHRPKMVTGAACESAVSEQASAGWDRRDWELRRRAEMRRTQEHHTVKR